MKTCMKPAQQNTQGPDIEAQYIFLTLIIHSARIFTQLGFPSLCVTSVVA